MFKAGELNSNWRGGKTLSSGGYVRLKLPKHPRADRRNGYVLEHILVAEKALGKALPDKAEVHHVNEDKADNRNSNLVICQDTAYHQLLHCRMRVRAAGGDPNKDRVCCTCQEVKPLGDFGIAKERPLGRRYDCRSCVRKLSKLRYARMTPEQKSAKHARGNLARRSKFWQDVEK